MLNRTYTRAFAALVCLAAATGCEKNAVDQGAFKSAINSYYADRHVCVWPSPVKFPAQADASNDQETKGFDALTDAGLLVRAAAEKKRFLIGSKQVTNYDLSDKGRSTWTPEQSQPGYGNFCFGHRQVTTIDSFTPATTDAVQYTVNFHSAAAGFPDWATSTEMKTAFPALAAAGTGEQAGTATLNKTSNGWAVTSVQ